MYRVIPAQRRQNQEDHFEFATSMLSVGSFRRVMATEKYFVSHRQTNKYTKDGKKT